MSEGFRFVVMDVAHVEGDRVVELVTPEDLYDLAALLRARVAEKAIEMRRQGFFGAAMLPMAELEYTGIMEKLAALDGRFRLRSEEQRSTPPVAATH